MSVQDPDATAVYAAEDLALSELTRTFARFAELQRWVRETVADQFWTDEIPLQLGVVTPSEVGVVRRSAGARYSAAERDRPVIHIRPGHWTTAVVLHELAHLVRPANGDPDRFCAHGAEFRRVQLLLVRRFMGFVAWNQLSRTYDDRFSVD